MPSRPDLFMKFKIDENLPVEVALLLRNHTLDADTVLEEGLGGQPDSAIAAVCKDESRILVTLDTDFCDMRTYPPKSYHGLVVLRLDRHDKSHVLGIMQRLIGLFTGENLYGRLWIVEENKLRIRG